MCDTRRVTVGRQLAVSVLPQAPGGPEQQEPQAGDQHREAGHSLADGAL